MITLVKLFSLFINDFVHNSFLENEFMDPFKITFIYFSKHKYPIKLNRMLVSE